MRHADLQNQKENADVDSIIPAYLVPGHDAPLAGFLVAVHLQFPLSAFHNPRLGIAGAGRKPGNLCNAVVMLTNPDLLQRFALALE